MSETKTNITKPMQIEDRFNIIKEVGDGLTARVFKAYDTESKRNVALKVLNQKQQKCWGKPAEEFLENEVRSLSQLQHENIVSLVTHGSARFEQSPNAKQDSQFMALEYVDGVELIDFLKCNGALSESVARHIFQQVAMAIKHVHENGVVHRDLKSDNIMITSGCQPRILDFGFSAKASGDLENGYFVSKLGTPAYMAPEIHQDTPFKGENADIFALAVILFQMVVGRPPFELAVKKDFLYKCIVAKRPDIFWRTHMKNAPKELSLTEDLKNLLFSMLQMNASERPQSVEEVLSHKWMVSGSEPTSDELTSTYNQRLALINQSCNKIDFLV